MKRTPSNKPAVKPTLALFIALLYHPGIGWTPKTHGAVFPAVGLSRVAFNTAAPSVNGGRGRGFSFLSMPQFAARSVRAQVAKNTSEVR